MIYEIELKMKEEQNEVFCEVVALLLLVTKRDQRF